MTVKQAVLEMIRRMPENVDVSDIISALQLRESVNEGLRQLDAGEGIPHDEAKSRLSRWLN